MLPQEREIRMRNAPPGREIRMRNAPPGKGNPHEKCSSLERESACEILLRNKKKNNKKNNNKIKIIRKRGKHIMVKQNIVFVENTPGSLQKVTKILAENQIDIYGFGCFDAPEFANFRMVCDDPEKADKIMAENGYMTRITQAILVDLQDEIGGLDKLLSVMGDSNVNLHYIYTFFHRGLKVPVAIMHCEDLLVAESVLRNNGFKVLNRLVDPDGVEEA